MTRINTIPPELLSDKWLLAEYREMPRISKLAKKTSKPDNYTLGTGHVRFFYDLGGYLNNRFSQITTEMKRRGYKCNFDNYRSHPEGLNNDWIPAKKDLELNIARLVEKFDLGQSHTINGQKYTKESWLELVNSHIGGLQ